MVTVADLELLFPGRGALAAGILRNSGILTDEPVAAAPEPEPPSADNAIEEGGDVV